MPLPSRPGGGGNQPPKPPVNPSTPPKISAPSTPQKLSTTIPPGEEKEHRVLGESDRYRHRKDLGSVTESAGYQSLGVITVEEALDVPYDKVFKRLEDKVLEIKNWLQEFLTEQNLTEMVAEARIMRGDKLEQVKARLDQLLLRYFSQNSLPQADVSRITTLVLNEILGYGPLEPLWQDPEITEIMVNGPYKVYIERGGKLRRAYGVQFRDAQHVLELAQQILGTIGKTLDIAHSYADGRLPDGSRINVTHPVIGPNGPFLTIRRFPADIFTIRKLLDFKSMTPEIAEEIGNLIYYKCSIIISGGTGSGKQLDDRTIIPTPTGYTTMGEIQPGEYVFDETGNPTKVTGKFQDKPNPEAYRVVFSDNNTVIADADHNWFTYTREERLQEREHFKLMKIGKTKTETTVFGKVRTTREIMETLLTENRSPNHAVKIAGPVKYVNTVTPQNPYALGRFLMEGVKETDQEHETPMVEFPVELFNNPTIPVEYMYASVADRFALLSGIADASAEITQYGEITITHSNLSFLRQIRTLIQSLGIIVYLETVQKKHSLKFTTDHQIFTDLVKQSVMEEILAHKTNKTVDPYRYIVSITPYDEPVSMHCITVDSVNHLYLASEAFIPTHNTSMLNALSGAIPRGERIVTIEDSLELRLHPDAHVISMEARQSQQAESKVGTVTIRDLVKNALRQRPDRIVVGEARDGAAYDMLQAMNTGHEGSLTTVHSNSPAAAIERISNLIAQVGELSSNQGLTLISSAVDIIVQINRYEDGSRRVSSLAEIPSRVNVQPGGLIMLEPRILWEFQQTGMDENNRIVGKYVKVSDYTEEFVKHHRLDRRPRLTLEELLEISDLPDEALNDNPLENP